MNANQVNIASYIRERSQELQKLSRDARLDLLVSIFGMAALEASKHEDFMLSPTVPAVGSSNSLTEGTTNDLVLGQNTLPHVLQGLVNVAANRSNGAARAAFYLANDVGTGLHRVAGMNAAYGAYTAGFKIGSKSIACGLAAAIRRPVITDNVMTDPSWEEWQWLATAFNYRSCWSFPIEGRGGKIFGTFSMYFEDPISATDGDIQFASIMTDTAAEIIARQSVASNTIP